MNVIKMDNNCLQMLVEFLNRTTLKGDEVKYFNAIMNSIVAREVIEPTNIPVLKESEVVNSWQMNVKKQINYDFGVYSLMEFDRIFAEEFEERTL